MWSQLTIQTVSRSESVACGLTMKRCMRPRQGQDPRRTVRVMPLPQEPCARCSRCVGAHPLWIAWYHKAALARMARYAPRTVTSTLHLATHLPLWQMIEPNLIAERSASPSALPCALPLDHASSPQFIQQPSITPFDTRRNDSSKGANHPMTIHSPGITHRTNQSIALPPISIPLHNVAKHTLCIDTITNTHPLLPTMS